MKILCICPIGIGNYICAYPSLHFVKQRRPEVELHLLALRKGIEAIATGDPVWEKIHCIDPTKERSIPKIAQFILSLRRFHFDASLSYFPSNGWQYNLFPLLCGARRRYGFSYKKKKLKSLSFLNTLRIAVDPQLHDLQQCLHLSAHFLGEPLPDEKPRFPELFADKDLTDVKSFIDSHNAKKIHIGIHPGSSGEHGMESKRWAPERFAELADRICSRMDADAFIFGGSDEEGLKKAVASAMKSPGYSIEAKDLRTTAALINCCTLMLCNDSGLMHIAASMGVPTAAVFGPTDERRNGPWGKNHCIIRKPMDGFPLWTSYNVGDRSVPSGIDPKASLNALSVNDAWEQIKVWLGNLERHTWDKT